MATNQVNATNKVRVGGAYTVFQWMGTVIGFANNVQVTSITPVADAQPIHPLDQKYVQEIVTPGAANYGVITLNLTELYNQSVWDRLGVLAGSNDIVDIMIKVASLDPANQIYITKVITPPVGGFKPYSETFHNCVITAVEDGETIDITTMSINKNVTVWFTNSTKNF